MTDLKTIYTVYMLRCSDATFYIGSTVNLEKRIREHNTPRSGAKYTRMRRPVSLVFSEICGSYADVRRREGELKRLKRAQKEMLIK